MAGGGQRDVRQVAYLIRRYSRNARLPVWFGDTRCRSAARNIPGAGPTAARPQSISEAALIPNIFRNIGDRRLLHWRFSPPIFTGISVLVEFGPAHRNVKCG